MKDEVEDGVEDEVTVESDRQDWIDRVGEAVKAVAGPEFAARLAEAWSGFAPNPLTRVTVYGPYDSGKTSLIKRLLLEDRIEPPEWLTVSARRETFTAEPATAAVLEFMDTPGMAGGNAQHDDVADDALNLADVLLVVLPPQLMTTDTEHLRAVATGALFGPAGAALFPAGALRVVVGRMDEAGIDPHDNPDAYRRLCDSKRAELTQLLSGEPSGAQPAVIIPPISLVSADPYGLGAPAGGGDLGQEWDGISALHRELVALAPRVAELRSAAEVRFWSRVAADALDAAGMERAQTASAADEARRELHQLADVGAEADVLVKAAEAELRTAILELLRSAVDTVYGASLDEVRAEAERRLDETVSAWAQRWTGRLDALVRTADRDLSTRALRAGADAYLPFVEAMTAPAVPSPQVAVVKAVAGGLVAQRIGHHARIVIRGVYQGRLEKGLGMPLDRAQHELAKLDRIRRSQRKIDKYWKTGIGLENAEQAKNARMAIQRLKILDAVLPSLIELGTMAYNERNGGKLLGQEIERRIELRNDLDATAQAIAARVMEGDPQAPGWAWNNVVAGITDGLAELARPLRLLVEVLEQRESDLAAAEGILDALLRSATL